MALDNAKNFAKVAVSTGYDAAATSIVLTTGEAAKLPTVSFNAVWYNSTDYSDPTDDPNREIVRVTAIATETLTITRAQEGTSASTKNTAGKTYKLIAGLTAKTINTDLPATLLPLAGGSLTGALNESKGADIASATTTDIGAATGNYVVVTGTTTITGLGTVQAGTRRIVKFAGILTLTHNATSLILPSSANITTVADDTATFVSLGSGNWVCVDYNRKSGAALVATAGGGAWTLVKYATGSGVGSLNITTDQSAGALSLQGDNAWKVIFSLDGNSLDTSALILKVNADSAAEYYLSRIDLVYNASLTGTTGVTGLTSGFALSSGRREQSGELLFTQVSGGSPSFNGQVRDWDAAQAANDIRIVAGRKTNSTNVTQLNFSLDTGTANWKVWILKPNTA